MAFLPIAIGAAAYYYLTQNKTSGPPQITLPPSVVDPYNPAKVAFLRAVNGVFNDTNMMGNVIYVRTASMYSDPWGTRAVIRANDGSVMKEPLQGDTVLRGTFNAMADYIIYNIYHGSSLTKISHTDAVNIIEQYVIAAGAENTLGRGGPTCSYACSVLKGFNIGDFVKSIGLLVSLVASFVAAPVTGGASLTATIPAAVGLVNTLK